MRIMKNGVSRMFFFFTIILTRIDFIPFRDFVSRSLSLCRPELNRSGSRKSYRDNIFTYSIWHHAWCHIALEKKKRTDDRSGCPVIRARHRDRETDVGAAGFMNRAAHFTFD